jgi:hypothetical protein
MNSQPPEQNAEALLNQLLRLMHTHKGLLQTTNLFERNLLPFSLTSQPEGLRAIFGLTPQPSACPVEVILPEVSVPASIALQLIRILEPPQHVKVAAQEEVWKEVLG